LQGNELRAVTGRVSYNITKYLTKHRT